MIRISDYSLRAKIVFIATGVFIGLLVSAQLKSSVPNSSYISDEIAVRQQLIKSYTDDEAILKSKIVSLRDKIEQQQESTKSSLEKNNIDLLNSLKSDLGLKIDQGAGIEITLNDGLFVNRDSTDAINDSLVQASDLRDIVNLLRAGKATSIAINDQRIIASTPITAVGNTILVNNFHVLPPFTIQAIGDDDQMLQLVNNSSLLPDLSKRIKDGKIRFAIKKKSGLSLPLYSGDLGVKYMSEPNQSVQ